MEVEGTRKVDEMRRFVIDRRLRSQADSNTVGLGSTPSRSAVSLASIEDAVNFELGVSIHCYFGAKYWEDGKWFR